MKKYALLIPVLLCLFSCKGDKKSDPAPATSPIVGQWVWQKENLTQYANGIEQIDTVLTASDSSYSSLLFNGDGTFISTGISITRNSFGTDTISGKYTYTASTFTTSNFLLGRSAAGYFTFTATGSSVPLFSPVSEIEQITQLTDLKLTLHTEYAYTVTVNEVSTTYKLVEDNYYYKPVPLL